jgi:hypothetical protein
MTDSPWLWIVVVIAVVGLVFAGLYRLSSTIEPDERRTEHDDHVKGDSD